MSIKSIKSGYRGISALAGNFPFSPADLSGLKLWLDADDASTITLNGSDVSQWNDKSVNAYNFAQSTAALQPERTLSGQNGKTVLTFNNEALTNASIDWGSSASTLFIVAKENSASTGWQNVFTTGTGANGQWGYGIAANSAGNDISLFDIAQAHQPFASEMTNTNADILCFLTAGISGGSITVELFKNGTADAINPRTLANTTSAAGASLGRNAAGNEPYGGTICEIIMYDTQLSATNREKVETYLKKKWATV
jgi:hypothetical protein